MRTVYAADIANAVKKLCISANRRLPDDVSAAIEGARESEPWPLARKSLGILCDNMALAEEKSLPVCQDTGLACVFVELGQDVHIEGDFEAAVQEGIRQGYGEGYLRKSVVADPLRRVNTGDNTPGFISLHLVPGDKMTVTLMPKGFGSENMSRLKMLTPSQGVEGVKEFVVETVKLAGPNPCPPIVVGVGIGGTFDKVTYLAKKALLRPLGQGHSDPFYAALEREMLDEINSLGIGPQGFGGRTTALSLAVEYAPTHVAGLPVAVNINCHATRRASAEL